MRKKLTALALFVALTLAACGAKPSTVEEYYKRPATSAELDKQLESTKEAYADMYSDISWDANGNTFEYHYTYAETIDPEVFASIESEVSSSLQAESASLIDAVSEECGIEDVSLRFVYYNPDGSVIFDETFSK